MLKLIKPKKRKRTKFEQAQAKAQAIRETLTKFEQAQSKLEAELEEAILAGKNTASLDKQLKAVMESIGDAVRRIEAYERAAQAALPDHLRCKIAGLKEEIQRIQVEGAEAAKEFEPVRKEFYKAEALFESGATKRGHRIGECLNEISKLQAELADLEKIEGSKLA